MVQVDRLNREVLGIHRIDSNEIQHNLRDIQHHNKRQEAQSPFGEIGCKYGRYVDELPELQER